MHALTCCRTCVTYGRPWTTQSTHLDGDLRARVRVVPSTCVRGARILLYACNRYRFFEFSSFLAIRFTRRKSDSLGFSLRWPAPIKFYTFGMIIDFTRTHPNAGLLWIGLTRNFIVNDLQNFLYWWIQITIKNDLKNSLYWWIQTTREYTMGINSNQIFNTNRCRVFTTSPDSFGLKSRIMSFWVGLIFKWFSTNKIENFSWIDSHWLGYRFQNNSNWFVMNSYPKFSPGYMYICLLSNPNYKNLSRVFCSEDIIRNHFSQWNCTYVTHRSNCSLNLLLSLPFTWSDARGHFLLILPSMRFFKSTQTDSRGNARVYKLQMCSSRFTRLQEATIVTLKFVIESCMLIASNVNIEFELQTAKVDTDITVRNGQKISFGMQTT